jgi:hypothetical protein
MIDPAFLIGALVIKIAAIEIAAIQTKPACAG